jgi:DNA-binding transcriptional MerR regulator
MWGSTATGSIKRASVKEQVTVDKAPDAFRTISEVAEDLDLPQHVLRFWETRFTQIKPMKRGGGRRYYRPDDIDLLRGIRHLLYGEGYTIRGVQRILKDDGVRFVQGVWRSGAPQPARSPADRDHGHAANVAAQTPGSGGEQGEADAERGRGLFGLLPSLIGRGSDFDAHTPPRERIEPLIGEIEEIDAGASEPAGECEEATIHQPPSSPAALSSTPAVQAAEPASRSEVRHERDSAARAPAGDEVHLEDMHKLRATLLDLEECRRLLDAALAEDG